MINTANLDKVKDELESTGVSGSSEFERLTRLRKWLFPNSLGMEHVEFRYAPSIVIRGEVELTGISIPRFAIRAYLDPSQRSFVNLRRLKTLDQQIRLRQNRQLPSGCSCIADCVLRVPQRFQGYNVVAANLGIVYGEASGWAEEFQGVPYMQHIPLAGGGMCAQAAGFMATVIMHEQARGVYGLAEITRLAAPLGEDNPLRISGLTMADLARYFIRAGLSAVQQRATSMGRTEQFSGNNQFPDFGSALRAYVCSGMPVILCVDAGRLQGIGSPAHPIDPNDSIYATNGFQCTADLRAEKEYRHAILVVGAHPERDEFLVHDPRALPFLRATSIQLSNASAYIPDTGMGQLMTNFFLPVTSSHVQLTLHGWISLPEYDPVSRFWGTCKSRHGLMSRIHLLESGHFLYGQSFLPPVPPQEQYGNLRLLTIDRLETQDIFRRNPAQNAHQLQLAVSGCVEQMKLQFGWGPDHWVWIHSTPTSVWFWDAEKPLIFQPPPPDLEFETAFLRCVLEFNIETSRWIPRWFGSHI